MSRRPARHAELAETLDRVLHKGAVLRGDLVLSVADVDLLYLDIRLFVSSVDKALEVMDDPVLDGGASPASDDQSGASRA